MKPLALLLLIVASVLVSGCSISRLDRTASDEMRRTLETPPCDADNCGKHP